MSLKQELLRHLSEDDTLSDYLGHVKNMIFVSIANPNKESALNVAEAFSHVVSRVNKMESIGVELYSRLKSSDEYDAISR
jgi:hypothetical protein